MMKKRKFGSGGMPSMKESMESGNRVSRQVGAETKKLMPATRSTRPSVGDAIASGNRMSKKNAEDLKAVKKYAKGGTAKKDPNNAYGSKDARDKVLRKVRDDIVGRDEADIKQVESKPLGVDIDANGPYTYRKVTKMEKMAYDDAKKRRGYAKGGKVKRYADGGMAGAAVDLEAAARRGENLRELDRMDFSVPKVEAPDKKQSFSAAFAAARKRGDKTFTWNGGSYGTKMKGEDDKPAKTTPPMSVAKEDKEIVVTGRRNQTSAPTKAAEPRVGLRNTSVGRNYADTLSKERASHADSNQKLVDRYKKEGRPNLAKAVSYLSGAKYAKGGSVTRGDGIAKKGHTKGKMR